LSFFAVFFLCTIILQIFWTISGLLFFISPRSSAKLWGRQESSSSDLENNDNDDTATLCLMKLSGAVWLSHFGVAAWLIFFQNENYDAVTTSSSSSSSLTTTSRSAAVQAFGYGALVWVAHFVNTLVISKDVDKLGLCKLPSYAWAMLNVVFSYLMIRGGSSGSSAAGK
jgi:hypothetical protein